MREPSPLKAASHAIVVTGVAAAACLGVDAETIWANVLAGKCGMAPMPDVESVLPPGSIGGQVADLPNSYRADLAREARYLRWTVEHALRDAGLTPGEQYAPVRGCAVLGTTLHGIRAGGRYLRTDELSELGTFLAGATASSAFDGLALEGGAFTTCSACSSSLGAIALGLTLLETGQADLVVAGGYDTISEYSWAGFNSLRLIAQGPLRPFCRGRQGIKVAEGYGIVVLERADAAARRGATVRACLAGFGESADAHHLTHPHPQGAGALAAMTRALQRANIRPEQLGMIASHATGTPDNDAAEAAALKSLLGDSLPQVPVVGFKSFLGHTLGGAGAVELVLSSMALRDGLVPGCPNVNAEEIEYDGLRVSCGRSVERNVGSTLNISLGFGGANTCVVLAEPGRSAPMYPVHAPMDVWITGVGVVLPGAVGHAAFVDRVVHGGPWAGTAIEDAALADYVNLRRTRRLSQYVKYTLAAGSMAVRDAGLADLPASVAAMSAILGSMHGSACFCSDYYAQIVKEGALTANPVLFAEGVPNAGAAHLSTTLGLKGSCQTIIGTRTAGLDALALASLRIRAGTSERMLVVAAEETCEIVARAYRAIGLQSAEGHHPASSAGAGFQSVGGGIAFVLESAEAARSRGAQPYARVNEVAWSAPTRRGPAVGVSSVVSRLGVPERVIGSACGTWLDRAERLGARRAGVRDGFTPGTGGFGEAFSATPLISIAVECSTQRREERFASICTDWSGAISGVSLDRMNRTIGSMKA